MRQYPLLVPMLLVAALLMLLPVSHSHAGVSGKISGLVADAKTGEPVVGATVRVLGTNLVTKTDIDGEYFIINVPSGKFDLAVSSVGHEQLVKSEVQVLVDLTTPVDFALKQTLVELDESVVVLAEQQVIQKDLTASRLIFTADRLRTLPNIQTVQNVLTNYPGVVVGPDNAMHVRGGRSGQVTYYYDGFSVQDPFVSNAGIRIMPASLSELSLTTGGFTAEYGEALSGVVSAVTPEGTSQYHGRLKTFTGFTHRYDVTSGTWGDLESISNRSLAGNLSGPVPGFNPKRFNFFVAGELLQDPGSLPHDNINSRTGILKLSTQPVSNLRLKSNVTYYKSDGDIYTHRDVNGRSYDFNLDGLPIFEKEAYLAGVSGNWTVGENSIVSATFNRFSTMTETGPDRLQGAHYTEWDGYSVDENGVYNGTIHEVTYGANIDYSDPMQVTGFVVGDDYDPTYHKRESAYNSFNLAYVNQVNKSNQIKTGFEYRQYDISWDFIQFYNQRPYGEEYSSKPKIASAFIQDKLEYDYFVINLGVRYDYHDADITYNATPQGIEATWKRAESKSQFSPRLGVSFPISEKTMMHFNYGFYYQAPAFQYLYTNLQGDITSGYPLLGNPNLEPEETVSYELGLDHVIGSDLRLDVTAYFKDIKDLVTTRSSFTFDNRAVTQFDNADYGSVKGIDVALEKLPGAGHLSASVAYSYMVARGNGSDAYEPYYTYITAPETHQEPITEYPLDFDQRHTLTAVFDYRVPAGWDGRLWGMRIPAAWGLNVVGRYGSGLPYTPVDANGAPLGERNEGRLPANYSVDMRFNKDFPLSGGRQNLSFFVEVDNLFDRRNVMSVYARTGRPDDDGYRMSGGVALDQAALDHYDYLYDHDPQNFSRPRTVRTGLEFTF